MRWFKRKKEERKGTEQCVKCGAYNATGKDYANGLCTFCYEPLNPMQTICEIYHCEVEPRDFHVGTYRTYEFRHRCVVCKEDVDNSKHECKGATSSGKIFSSTVGEPSDGYKSDGNPKPQDAVKDKEKCGFCHYTSFFSAAGKCLGNLTPSQIAESVIKKNQDLRPYKCPVCDGTTIVKRVYNDHDTVTIIESCHACEKGVLWK